MQEFTFAPEYSLLEGERKISFLGSILSSPRCVYISVSPRFFRFIHQRLIAKFPEARRTFDPITSARDKRFARWEKLSAEGRQSGQIERDKGYDKSNYLPLARSGKDVVAISIVSPHSPSTNSIIFSSLRFQGEKSNLSLLPAYRHEIKSVKNYCN